MLVCALRRLAGSILTMAALGLVFAQGASAQGFQVISSSGPLTNIWTGDTFTCQVAHSGDTHSEFYGGTPGSCGTFLSVDAPAGAAPQLYGGLLSPTDFTAVSQSPVFGSGTARDPYRVTTVADAGTSGLRVTQADSYAVGDEHFRTDITVANTSGAAASGKLYHAADCYLQDSDVGYGFVDTSSNAVACAKAPNNNPPALIEEFAPLTAGAKYVEGYYGTVYDYVRNQTDLPNTCGCDAPQDNGMAINWDVSLAPGESKTFSMLSNFSTSGVVVSHHTITATGGYSFSGTAPAAVNGTVATFSDSSSATTPADFSATIDWGDGVSSAGTVSGGNGSFSVTGDHTYATPGSYTIRVMIAAVNGDADPQTVTGSATINAPPPPAPPPRPANSAPSVVANAPAVKGSSATDLSGTTNPGGLPTTAHWEYGLDRSYRGAGFSSDVFDQTTPAQSVGPDFSDHLVQASLSNLLPNALYHARLVASNSAGTTIGSELTFRTAAAAVPPAPILGQKLNLSPSGSVFVLQGGKFVKLTQARQLPSGTVVDALHGSLNVVSATGQKGKKNSGTFGGAIFKVAQSRAGADKGVTTLSIVEAAYKGAPSFAGCQAKGARDGRIATRAALSSRVLQSLRAKASGRFRTQGRYAAGTVRGTKWTTTDRCDGTLISVQQHSVLVNDLVKHISKLIGAGHKYLARAPKGKP